MGQKKFCAKGDIQPCPKCGNKIEFVAKSNQVAEDCCEVWVVCVCGFDPTAENTNARVEDIWGSLDESTIICALDASWNEIICK